MKMAEDVVFVFTASVVSKDKKSWFFVFTGDAIDVKQFLCSNNLPGVLLALDQQSFVLS